MCPVYFNDGTGTQTTTKTGTDVQITPRDGKAEDLKKKIEDRIAKCVDIKARVVGADEREGGLRAILNYGHTLAHALEIGTGWAMTHGEAVAVGLIYAAHLAHRLGRIDQAAMDRHHRIVAGVYGLATRLPDGISADRLLALMGRDKKALSSLTFVLDGPRGVELVEAVAPEVALAALESLDRA